MKNFIKSLSVIAIVFIVGYLYPITSYAYYTVENNTFRGTYDNLTNQVSFIKINKEDCSAIVVYSSDKNEFISATGGWGYMKNDSFTATFSKYVVKDKNGNTITTINSPVDLYGTYKKTKKYIDITVGGIIYEKKL